MARGVGRSGSGRPVFSELQQNGDPPQSTLAAQLVNRFTDGKNHSKHQDRESFRQLLREVLGAESEQGWQAQTHDTDNDVNCKLVYVIVKAGLETLANGDPFGGQIERSRQAVDSLAAVEYTLRKNPEILFIPTPGDESLPNPNGPLFLWLIPKLLNVAGQLQDEGIGDCLLKLLRTIVSVERKIHIKGVRIYSIVKYVKGCIRGQLEHSKLDDVNADDTTDLLTYLEASDSVAARFRYMPKSIVPSATTISKVYPGYLQDHNPHNAFQVMPNNKAELLSMTMCLLALSTTILPSAGDTMRTINSSSPHGRVLSDLTRFWNYIASEGVQLDSSQVSVTSLVLFLNSLRSFCTHFTATYYQVPTLARFSLLLSQVTTTFLSIQPLPLLSSIETSLCLNLITVAALSQKSDQFHRYFVDDVLPSIAGAKRDPGRFDGLGKDLQV